MALVAIVDVHASAGVHLPRALHEGAVPKATVDQMQEQVVTGVERVLLAALVGSLLTLSLALWQARRVALGEALLLLRLVLLVGHPAMPLLLVLVQLRVAVPVCAGHLPEPDRRRAAGIRARSRC